MAFLSEIYEEHGISPFILIAFLICFIAFFIYVLAVQGSPSCFHSFQSGDYCTYCGEQLQQYCPACDTPVSYSSFCGSCGHALN